MNNNTNNAVDIQASNLKGDIHRKLNILAERLGADPVRVPTSDVQPHLTETNTWLAQLDEKLNRILIK